MAKVFDPPKHIKVPAFNMDTYKADEEKFRKELKDFLIKRKPGKNVGRIAKFQVADSYAEYMIASMSPLELIHIPLGDAYEYSHVTRLKAKDIEVVLGQDDFWDNIKKKCDAEWFKRLKDHGIKPGDVVHDMCGRNSKFAVRCVLQEDGSLKDVSIVGEVDDYEMPKIFIGGDAPKVHYGYHIGRAHKGESKVWSNRINEFPELDGDFSWREKPVNEKAMVKLEITPEIEQKHNQYNAAEKLLNDFRYGNITFAQFQLRIANIK